METRTPALDDPRLRKVKHTVVRHGRVSTMEQAADARGVKPSQIVKTMVVRRSKDEYIFALVPGDRVIDWAKLRKVTGERRLSLADAAVALKATGYLTGTITPFGSVHSWQAIADTRVAEGPVSIGGGAPGVSISLEGKALVSALEATVANITKVGD